jgi:hypothetical protein
MLLTERYQDKIAGVLSCYDRVIIQGTLPGWSFDKGMTSFLSAQGIRIFDYPGFAGTLREEVRENTERIARESGLEIEFIRKVKQFRKEKRIREILEKRGDQIGLVHIFSAMESCTSYKPWHDKNTGNTFLKYDSGKCLHYYFYFIDKEFGLCYLRVPTWCPFRLQFYCNGHNWLATKLKRHGIPFVIRENAFFSLDDFPKAQDLSDAIRVEDLHQALDLFAQRYCPLHYSLPYQWTIMQAEYATDILFYRQADLQDVYEPLIRTAVHSVKPEHIASFLGQKLHPRYEGEMGNNFETRILGTRIKHRMGALSIKMYDKFGIILRIETTVNDVSQFKRLREVNGHLKTAPMKKSIYSLFPLASLLRAANRRYLEFISQLDDPGEGMKKLEKISRTVEHEGRPYKGFNFYDQEDQRLFEILVRGEFNINGLQNKSIRTFLPGKNTGMVSRILRRLRSHGLIKKVGRTYKYYLTKLGKAVIVTGLRIKQMMVVPELAGLSSQL